MTKTGKSWFAKRRATLQLAGRQKVLVHSGTGDTDFPTGSQIFFDAPSFEAALNDPENFGAFVIVDEASLLFRQQATSPVDFPTINNLAQMGRHRGYSCTFITQYPTALNHAARVNCDTRVVFRQGSKKNARLICDDAGVDYAVADELTRLPQLHFVQLRPMEEPQRFKLG